MLDSLITSKTRIKLLLKFFANNGNSGYLRSLAEEFGESTNSVRVELNRLSDAGLLESKNEGKTITYQANTSHPFYANIRSMVAKYLGFDEVIEKVIARLGNVEKAMIIGDYAQGRDTGTIHLLLQAEDIDQEYLDFLIQKAEDKIQRKVQVEVVSLIAEEEEGLVLLGEYLPQPPSKGGKLG